jgi:hypothetical protein
LKFRSINCSTTAKSRPRSQAFQVEGVQMILVFWRCSVGSSGAWTSTTGVYFLR